jgi:penicillin-binding protein 1C
VETSAEVLARDGRCCAPITVADGRWRLAVDAWTRGPAYVAMLLAYEDRRFTATRAWTRGAAARGWQAATAGRVVSGGSTLTMQVARLLEDSGTGAVARQAAPDAVALALERRLTKDQILGLYLHLAPYGGNIEGVRAATLAWLGKEPRG